MSYIINPLGSHPLMARSSSVDLLGKQAPSSLYQRTDGCWTASRPVLNAAPVPSGRPSSFKPELIRQHSEDTLVRAERAHFYKNHTRENGMKEPEKVLQLGSTSAFAQMSPADQQAAIDKLRNLSVDTKLQYNGLKFTHCKGEENCSVAERRAMHDKAINSADMKEYIDKKIMDPSSIPVEMKLRLGVKDTMPNIPAGPSAMYAAEKLVLYEADEFLDHRYITDEQHARMCKRVAKAMKLYAIAFPEKTAEEAYIMGRDLVRVMTYQEIRDKEHSSGSDHGSKHIHHNIKFAKQMIDGVDAKDLTDKDKFMLQMIHIYHDIGYTVGTAHRETAPIPGTFDAVIFRAQKDHPVVGAKMIEMNKDYFVRLIGEAGYSTLRDSVLYHAIPSTQFKNGTIVEGIHKDLVMSVVTISDACAVASDIKSAEFFRKPDVIRQLARLQIGLRLYDKEDAKKKELLESVRLELLRLAEVDTNTPHAKREGYRLAIEKHFNAFGAKNVMGQYTATVDKVKLINPVAADADYEVYITAHTSRSGAVIGAIFENLAQEAISKLVKDLGGNWEEIKPLINEHARAVLESERYSGSVKPTPMILRKGQNRLQATFKVGSSLSDDLPQVTQSLETIESHSFTGPITLAKEHLMALSPEKRTAVAIREVVLTMRARLAAKFEYGGSGLDVSIEKILEKANALKDKVTIDNADFDQILKDINELRVPTPFERHFVQTGQFPPV